MDEMDKMNKIRYVIFEDNYMYKFSSLYYTKEYNHNKELLSSDIKHLLRIFQNMQYQIPFIVDYNYVQHIEPGLWKLKVMVKGSTFSEETIVRVYLTNKEIDILLTGFTFGNGTLDSKLKDKLVNRKYIEKYIRDETFNFNLKQEELDKVTRYFYFPDVISLKSKFRDATGFGLNEIVEIEFDGPEKYQRFYDFFIKILGLDSTEINAPTTDYLKVLVDPSYKGKEIKRFMNYIKKGTSSNFIEAWTSQPGSSQSDSYFNSTKAYFKIEALIRKKENRIIEETILHLESIIKGNDAGIKTIDYLDKTVDKTVKKHVSQNDPVISDVGNLDIQPVTSADP